MVVENELRELERRERTYRGDRPKPEISGLAIILIDYELATVATMSADAAALKTQNSVLRLINADFLEGMQI